MAAEHVWTLMRAVQQVDGDDVLDLTWKCLHCAAHWGTISGVEMPDEEGRRVP